jgi:hypothetical protein
VLHRALNIYVSHCSICALFAIDVSAVHSQLQGRAPRYFGRVGEVEPDIATGSESDSDDDATVASGNRVLTPVPVSSMWQDVPLSDGVDVVGSFLRCSRSSRPSADEADELRTTLLQMSPLARRRTCRGDVFRALLLKGLEAVGNSVAMTTVLDLLCTDEVRTNMRIACERCGRL